MKVSKFVFPAVVILLLFFHAAVSLLAEEPESRDYDAYARILADGPEKGGTQPEKENLIGRSLGFPAWPLDWLRWGIDNTVYYVERHHIDEKATWIYERITDYGIYPKLANLANFGNFGTGVDLDFVKLLRQQSRVPYLRAKAGLLWAYQELFEVNVELGIDKLQEVGPYGSVYFDFQDRPDEDFFGIGPNTSRGDGANFHSETTLAEARFGYSFTLSTDIHAKVAYKNVTLTEGEDDGKGQIEHVFPQANTPGLKGGEFFIFGGELAHDTRDFPEDPHKGAVARAALSYHEGIDGSDFGFFTYQAEFAKYQEVFSERQVIGLRLLGEHHDEMNDRSIPFFEMSRLGGYGVAPSPGYTHRGFQKNRFFGESVLVMNLEYRYVVWQYRDFSIDAVIFWDEGQVFNEWSDFEFKDFRESIGGGLRFKILRKSILSVELARSDDGVEFYARSQTPF